MVENVVTARFQTKLKWDGEEIFETLSNKISLQEKNDKNDKLCHDQSLQAIQPIFDNRNNKTYML